MAARYHWARWQKYAQSGSHSTARSPALNKVCCKCDVFIQARSACTYHRGALELHAGRSNERVLRHLTLRHSKPSNIVKIIRAPDNHGTDRSLRPQSALSEVPTQGPQAWVTGRRHGPRFGEASDMEWATPKSYQRPGRESKACILSRGCGAPRFDSRPIPCDEQQSAGILGQPERREVAVASGSEDGKGGGGGRFSPRD
eukprot:3199147-Rhodomonas_salina.2